MDYSQISTILGGQVVADRWDLVELGSRGVSKAALVRLAKYFSYTVAQMAEVLPVTERTIQRYRPQQRFNQVVSEQILQIAEVAARGEAVFGDRQRFLAWLAAPSHALGQRTPASLLGSRFGAEMVRDELGRIEHGIFA